MFTLSSHQTNTVSNSLLVTPSSPQFLFTLKHGRPIKLSFPPATVGSIRKPQTHRPFVSLSLENLLKKKRKQKGVKKRCTRLTWPKETPCYNTASAFYITPRPHPSSPGLVYTHVQIGLPHPSPSLLACGQWRHALVSAEILTMLSNSNNSEAQKPKKEMT